MLTKDEIQALIALEAKTVKAPWWVYPPEIEDECFQVRGDAGTDDGRIIGYSLLAEGNHDDCQFLSQLRNAAPQLLQMALRAVEMEEVVKEMLWFFDHPDEYPVMSTQEKWRSLLTQKEAGDA